MALGATVRSFDIELSDIDRSVYESFQLKIAQHPSESAEYLVARVLAYALEHGEGIGFTGGLYDTDQPAVHRQDLTGQRLAWIEVGTPDPVRLHKASKSCDAVAVYCHKEPRAWLLSLAGSRVHQHDKIALYALSPRQIRELAATLGRRHSWTLSRIEGTLYFESEDHSAELSIQPLDWPIRASPSL